MQRKISPSILLAFFVFITASIQAQETDTLPDSIDPQLLELTTTRVPKEYTIAGIKITGTKYLDEQLLISISGLSVGDKILIPGGDQLSKAIANLWKQNLFEDIGIYYTKLEGTNLYLEINVSERPRLSKFSFKGIRKSDADELNTKSGLIPGRVVTENVKRNAVEAIQKYYTDKGFQSATVRIQETREAALANSINLTFFVERGKKVRINEVSFYGNEKVRELKLKKQMKGTKEMTRITLFPAKEQGPYGVSERVSFKEYLGNAGFLSFSKTKEFLDPYFRFKLFSSAKFNATKYQEDKDKVLEFYNSLGYRDAVIVADTHYINNKGNLNVDLKVNEGRRYYFGNIAWKGNTKYSDSILNMLLGIKNRRGLPRCWPGLRRSLARGDPRHG
jgi:outer membrane protein insertion porin family